MTHFNLSTIYSEGDVVDPKRAFSGDMNRECESRHARSLDTAWQGWILWSGKVNDNTVWARSEVPQSSCRWVMIDLSLIIISTTKTTKTTIQPMASMRRTLRWTKRSTFRWISDRTEGIDPIGTYRIRELCNPKSGISSLIILYHQVCTK